MSVTAARIQRIDPVTRKREVVAEFRSTLTYPGPAVSRVLQDVYDYLNTNPKLEYDEIWLHFRKTPHHKVKDQQ